MATVIVKKGDTLSALSKKYGISLSKMLELNPNKKANPNLIYIGESLNIPDVGTDSKTAGTEPAVEPVKNVIPPETTHIFSPDEYNLIKFSSDPDGDGPMNASTVWLLDSASKTLRPFLNQDAFNNFFKDYGFTLQDAANQGKIYTASTDLLLPGKALGDVKILGTSQGITSSGTIPASEVIDTQAASNRYGQEQNQQAENNSLNFLFGTGGNGGWLKTAQNSGISASTISEVSQDANLLHLYVQALTYGGYTPTNIFQDLKRRQAIKDGDTTLTGVKVIDENMPAEQYYSSSNGKSVISNPALTLPSTLSGITTDKWNYTLNNLPKEAFDTVVKPFDWNSEEGKALMNNVKTSYYDIMLNKLNATTEQEQTAADYAYKKLQESMLKNYGIQLSDNANTAWTQLNQLTDNFSARGLAGSGLAEEGIDAYLNSVRKSDQRIRDTKATEEEQKKYEYYKTSATPEQIAALSDEEKTKWGFKPSAEVMSQFDLSALKAKYPDVPEERLKAYRDSVLDENGNYRSTLYQNMFANKLDLLKEKEEYQLGKVEYDTNGNVTGGYGAVFQKALEEQNKRNWLNMNKDYYGDTSKTGTTTGTTTGNTDTTSGYSNNEAAKYIASKNDTSYNTETPTQVPTTPTTPVTPSTPTTPTTSTYTPPPGYEAIAGPWDIGNYQPNNTITNNGTLYGIRKTTPTSTNNNYQEQASKAAANINNPTPPVQQPQTNTGTTNTSPSSSYTGSSIVDYLKSTGGDSSYSNRAALAKQYGISNYVGSATQNTQLLKQLRGY